MRWTHLSGRTESWGWGGDGSGWIGIIGMPLEMAWLKDMPLSTSMPLLMARSIPWSLLRSLFMPSSLFMSMPLPKTRGTASDIAMSCWGPTSPGTAVSLFMYLKWILSLRVSEQFSNLFNRVIFQINIVREGVKKNPGTKAFGDAPPPFSKRLLFLLSSSLIHM